MIRYIQMASIALIIGTFLTSCGGCSQKSNQGEQSTVYMINHSNDVGKYGEGTYINTNSETTCPHCGMRVSRDNIFHDCQGTKFTPRSKGNQYGQGYKQGQDDASRGLDANPDGYGGNGQFEKGYEDGYEDW